MIGREPAPWFQRKEMWVSVTQLRHPRQIIRLCFAGVQVPAERRPIFGLPGAGVRRRLAVRLGTATGATRTMALALAVPGRVPAVFPFEMARRGVLATWLVAGRAASTVTRGGLLARADGRFQPGNDMGRDRLAGVTLDIAQLLEIIRRGERNGDAFGARTAGAADAMHIIFGAFREIEVDDMRNAGDVDAACGHVGRHQQAHRA